jgi:uncharacterized membrane protein (UPF0182 family)/uncharacterized membrane protein YbhN (UPF0104 family)
MTLIEDEVPPHAEARGGVGLDDSSPRRAPVSRSGSPAAAHLRYALSGALGLLLLIPLVVLAGPWSVAASTRALDLLIRGGLVQLTDMDAGYVAGVPEAELYLRSQSPIDAAMLVLAALVLGAAWVVRSLRGPALVAARGSSVPWRWTFAVALHAEAGSRLLPFDRAEVRFRRHLTRQGVPRDEASRAVNALRAISAIELLSFAVLAGLFVGVTVWLESMFWAVVVVVVAALLARNPSAAARRQRRRAARSMAAAGLARLQGSARLAVVALSFAALPLEEMAAYLVVQSLSSDVVILGGMTPVVLLVALVAGKLGSLVKVTPGGLGQFELAFAAALYAQGQGLAEAVTVTLVFALLRYLTAGILLAASSLALRSTRTDSMQSIEPAPSTDPVLLVPEPPPILVLLRRLFVVAAVVLALVLLGRFRGLLVDYWLLDSLGFESVFWTNLGMKSTLFVGFATVWAVAVGLPLLRDRSPGRSVGWRVAVTAVVAVAAGTVWAGRYQEFLLLRHGQTFGDVDPVFGHGIGFYVFQLPAITATVWGLTLALAVSLAVTAALVLRTAPAQGPPRARLQQYAAALGAHSSVLGLVVATGLLGALGVWLRRYDVLFRSNDDSSIATGAEALDVDAVVSTVNLRAVQALATLLLTAALVVGLLRCRQPTERWFDRGPRTWQLLGLPILVVLVATSLVAIRDATRVTPNEPVAQLEYLRRHIDATNKAWGMDDVELTNGEVNGTSDPLPDLEQVIAHPTIANAQLWPGAISWLERLLDPQHVDRIFLEHEERSPDLVFGATLDTFRQQQKLRPYYDFLDVDVVNYPLADGTPRLTVTSVRELPLIEPQPWLAFWGQRFVLFTHGHGVVAAPLGAVGQAGGPAYLSAGVPAVVADPSLRTGQPAVYYGEGSGTMGFSNVRDLAEFDYPTDQGRADVFLPADVDAGVRIDSIWKRLAFAWGAQEYFDPRDLLNLAFSDLITSDTRVHYQRQPLDRVAAVAPFLYLDSDPYAVVGEDGITWMVNGVTTTDRYPYSAYGDLGDKSVRRGPFTADVRRVNYAADAVKATVDAYTGAVRLYAVGDDPILDTWAAIYPELFTPASEMPADVRAHQQYPAQLFHTQFDDLWIYYHVTDPVAFFNQEDLFDDADEVLGPMLAPGKGITFSIEPYPTVIETASHRAAPRGQYSFAQSQIFTPEGARTLRSIVTVTQGPDDYGRLSMLQFPKGSFVTSPEQAESIIDQNADIAQQFGFWSTNGVEVIRGYMTSAIVEGELIYIEPVFIRSSQNPYPQLSRVVVVMRGEAAMGETTDQAIRAAYAALS